ncbi:DUF6179 domain-containing protein [Paenibacillus chibensis]|uniref:DUF6179 domain-containing protein n=1 Tax=Paenibacillus chibensis TaxID=59846 RepID=UPI000FD7B5E3|nr:DUF6179 domain-containing protein [Paenibacillus chibensis]MEC0373344.1 DUF6179 domain-containing protein [Paenibacillus chibensis]
MGSEDLNHNLNVTPRGMICKSRLMRNQYTVSLMNEGMRAGLLASQDVMRIQHGLMQILKELIQRYTQGESSSVTTETAESILTSIMYAADAYLFELETPEQAVAQLKSMDVQQIYDRGVKKVSQCFEETKALYKEVMANKLDIPVEAYHLTIEESLPVFLRKYGIVFEAHNTMASIDYPLAVDDMRLQGVFYMKQYLERLQMENDFCSLFDPQECMDLLVNYGKECRFDYRIELFNMYELVLHQAIFSLLSGGAPNCIRISESQFNRLEQRFMSLTESQIHSVLFKGMAQLQQALPLYSRLKAYMDACRLNLVHRVTNAAKHSSLRAVVITEREKSEQSMIISFHEEDRLSDIALRKLWHEIMACERVEDKVNLILSRVHSLHDYLDLLESDCLLGDEYDHLFHSFGNMELAILAKLIFYEELRGDSRDLRSILLMAISYESEWHMEFVRSLGRMDPERVQAIEKVMDAVDYEQMTFY